MRKFLCILLALLFSTMGSMEVYAMQGTGNGGTSGTAIEKSAGNRAGAKGEDNPGNSVAQGYPVRVLIVGNSFSKWTSQNITYTVEQPLEELAAGEGRNIDVKTLAHGSAWLRYYAGLDTGYLSYHRELVSLLVGEDWDYIIFQEQTTSPIEYLEERTYPAVERLLDMVKIYQPQATPLLYMNQGFSDGVPIKVNGTPQLLTAGEMELRLAAGYHLLKQMLQVEVVPVGMHANRAHILYPWMRLVGIDSKHPAYAGYFLAAASFYYRIYGELPDPRKATLKNCSLSEQELLNLVSLVPGSIRMDKEKLTLKTNESATVTAIAPGSSGVTYKSLNTNIASVNPATGAVKGNQQGDTVVAAVTPDGLQAFCSVSVRTPLSFSRQWYLAGQGYKIQIRPSADSGNLRWSSSNTGVAAVDPDTGLVDVKASGKAVITVVNQDNTADKASYTLYVTCSMPEQLKTSSANGSLAETEFGNIKIAWNAVPGASSYGIYRSTTKNGPYSLIGTSKKRNYVDKTAKVNTYYFYKIAANNAHEYCTSSLSMNTRGITLKAPALTVKRLKNGQAKLSWKKNPKATGYVIYACSKKNSGFKEIVRTTSKNKITYTDKSLKKKKIRYYRIRAYKVLDGKIFYGVRTKSVKAELLK